MANVTHCPKFNVDNGSLNTTDRHIGAVVGVVCKDNHELHGDQTLICRESGIWNHFTPACVLDTGSGGSTVIVAICVTASIVALAIVLFALYMLCKNLRKDRKKNTEKRDVIESIRDMSNYHAETQDCVGMPALVYSNMNSTLRGRPEESENSDETGSPVDHDITVASEKAFIY